MTGAVTTRAARLPEDTRLLLAIFCSTRERGIAGFGGAGPEISLRPCETS
jgi:hypothetical protein